MTKLNAWLYANRQYLETHFEISAAITRSKKPKVKAIYKAEGQTGLYRLAEELTTEFQTLYKKTDWDKIDYWLLIDHFIKSKSL